MYSSDVTEPYNYGTTATYQCDSGYELTRGDTVRTCTGDGSSPVGQWNGSPSVCSGTEYMYAGRTSDISCKVSMFPNNDTLLTAVSCGSPPSIDNGSPGIPIRATFGGVVTYSCDTGFVLSGNATVKCLASANWGPLPFCSGKRVVQINSFIQVSYKCKRVVLISYKFHTSVCFLN